MKAANQSGFTLIELIITLSLGALLGAMLVPFLSTALTKSSMSSVRLNETLTLQTTMENITADYQNRVQKNIITLADLQTAIGAVNSDQNNGYGSYRVVANGFIDFVNEAEVADTVGTAPQDTLKVTIRDPSGMTFTTLFSTEL